MMRNRKNPRSRRRHNRPTLRFTPYAWAKLVYLRDLGGTEIGGFALSDPEDLLLVEDIVLVEQHADPVNVAMIDQSVADYFDAQVDAGRTPQTFARIWVHTHPGDSADPSPTDEETFERVFGACDWAIMFILARGGQTYCRGQFRAGPGAGVRLRVEVDYSRDFAASRRGDWNLEYQANVHPAMRQRQSSMLRERLWPEDILEPQDAEWIESFYADERVLI